MFDLGMSELLVIGIVALIVIGPKDLPGMFATLGRFTAKARAMSREFSRAMEAAAKESGVNDVAKDLKAATSAKSMGLDAVKDAASKFEKWDPLKPQARSAVPTPAAMTPIVPLSEAPNVALGPATKALAEKQIERRIQSNAKVDALRAAAAGSKAAPVAEVPVAAAPVRGGRVRSKAAEASPVTKAAVKPAVKPATAKPAATKTAAAKPKSPKADA
jgi:sec-independent protein translocase protein TatB